MKSLIFIVIYVIILISIFVLRFINDITDVNILLNKNEYNFLFFSSLLYIILFYLLKSFLTDINIDYIIPVGICYMIWYFVSRLITNFIKI